MISKKQSAINQKKKDNIKRTDATFYFLFIFSSP